MPRDPAKTLNVAFEKQEQRHILSLAGRGCWRRIVSFVTSALNSAFHIAALDESPPQYEIKKNKENFWWKKSWKKKDDCEYVNFVYSCLSAGTALKGLFRPPIKENCITNSTLSPKEKRVKFSENPGKHWHDFYYSKFNPTFSECAWREGRILPLCPGKCHATQKDLSQRKGILQD